MLRNSEYVLSKLILKLSDEFATKCFPLKILAHYKTFATQNGKFERFCGFCGDRYHRLPKRNVRNGALWPKCKSLYGDQEFDIHLIKFVLCMCNLPNKDS